jgi:hypothetical protein
VKCSVRIFDWATLSIAFCGSLVVLAVDDRAKWPTITAGAIVTLLTTLRLRIMLE